MTSEKHDYKEYIDQLTKEQQKFIEDFYDKFYNGAYRNDAQTRAILTDYDIPDIDTIEISLEGIYATGGARAATDYACMKFIKNLNSCKKYNSVKKLLHTFWHEVNWIKKSHRKESR